MRRAAAGGLLALVALSPAAAWPAGAEAPPGASSCTGCHAMAAGGPAVLPPLGGRAPEEITTAMLAFRSGAQPATVMDRIAKGFSEAEIQAIAAWFAAQR